MHICGFKIRGLTTRAKTSFHNTYDFIDLPLFRTLFFAALHRFKLSPVGVDNFWGGQRTAAPRLDRPGLLIFFAERYFLLHFRHLLFKSSCRAAFFTQPSGTKIPGYGDLVFRSFLEPSMNLNINSGVVQIRLQVKPFGGHNMQALETKGWRCFVRKSATGPSELFTWILKRGASVVMLVQSKSESQPQTVSMPSTDEASELCGLFVQAGLALPA